MAEKASPDLRAYLERENQSKASTRIQSAYYYPHLDAAGVDSAGFPGSGSPSPYGFGGLVNSPYRSGAAVDVNATWTLFDASLGSRVTAFRYQERSSRAQTYVTRMQVDEQALQLYFQASLYRGQKETWNGIVDRLEPIIKIVKHFVRTGRYNEVQLLLLQNQQDDARLKADTYEQQYQGTLNRLGLVLGLIPLTPSTHRGEGGDEGQLNKRSPSPQSSPLRGEEVVMNIQVPKPSDLNEQSLAVISEPTQNPLLDYAQSEINVAKAVEDSARAERLPRLYVTGSVGAMENTRLVSNSDYSGWAGVSVPVFEGFLIDNEERRARASFREKSDRLVAAQLQVNDLNAQYDQAIQTAQIKIKELDPQYEAAKRNFALAKERYLNFLGTVTDLEETLRNLATIEAEMNSARIGLLSAEALKKLSNGGKLKD